MRYALILAAIGVFMTAVQADPVHYEQIPADATSYLHVDVEQLMASRLGQVKVNDVGTVNQNIDSDGVNTLFGGPIKSATIYSSDTGAVLLLCASTQGFHDKVETPHSTNTVVFNYDQQEVHSSSANLFPELFGGGATHDSSNGDHRGISIGLNGAATQFHGAFYTAYIGSDLIVMAVDLPAMAKAIDVLHAKKPSLANQDPSGIKGSASPGLIAVGAGLSAQWSGVDLGQRNAGANRGFFSSTQPVNPPRSDFGLDLFGSFKGKAKLARFVAGEDDQNDYIDVTFTMIDGDSATQLKNLILGAKAFVQLSKNTNSEIIDPLDAESAGNDVNLRWATPTAKLSELFHISSKHVHRFSTSLPTTQPGN